MSLLKSNVALADLIQGCMHRYGGYHSRCLEIAYVSSRVDGASSEEDKRWSSDGSRKASLLVLDGAQELGEFLLSKSLSSHESI